MAFDEKYANRVRDLLAEEPNVTERKMFGSLGFMVNGHLTVGVGDGSDGSILMVRIDKDQESELLEIPGASNTIMRGRPMSGWIDLTPAAVETDEQLEMWLDKAVSFVQTLPPKND